MEERGLVDTYKVLPPAKAEYTFFRSAHGTFTKVHHMLATKHTTVRIKKIETALTSFTDYDAFKI